MSLPPLLRWAGGKRVLLPQLVKFIPDNFGTYFEPFLGGAAVFFYLGPRRAVLSDTNEELINCYLQVRINTENVIAALESMRNSEEDYYRIRAARPTSDTDRAARLLYLMAYSFNGIYRTNLQGTFNVPYGRRAGRYYTADSLRAAATALHQATLTTADFEEVLTEAHAGDLIYLDPPYTVAHGNNGFVKYNARLFSWSDQIRLAHTAANLARRGCTVIVSNAAHPSVQELYSGFDMFVVERQSRIAAASYARKRVPEYVFVAGNQSNKGVRFPAE